MNALIILNGECSNCTYLFNQLEKYDLIICADGGYKHLQSIDAIPDAVLGDFDSVKQPNGINTVKYPVEKNMTDGEIAIEYALEKGADEIVLTCALGGRVDHEMANLFLLTRYKNVRIEEEKCSVLCISGEFVPENAEGKTISLIPYMEADVRLENFKYPLDGTINVGSTLTMSNIAQKNAKILVKKGKCLLIINHTI